MMIDCNPVGFPVKRWNDIHIYGRAYTLRLMAADARRKAARKMQEILYVERVSERGTEDLKTKAKEFTQYAFHEEMADFMNWEAFRHWKKLVSSCETELKRRQDR